MAPPHIRQICVASDGNDGGKAVKPGFGAHQTLVLTEPKYTHGVPSVSVVYVRENGGSRVSAGPGTGLACTGESMHDCHVHK